MQCNGSFDCRLEVWLHHDIPVGAVSGEGSDSKTSCRFKVKTLGYCSSARSATSNIAPCRPP